MEPSAYICDDPSISAPGRTSDTLTTAIDVPIIAPPRWYQVGGADLVFAVVALLVFHTARQGLLDDPGLGWHLRNIDAMLAQKAWLKEDTFSEPRLGQAQPWRSNQWLGEIPFWLGERWAGLEGIAAVAALLIAFALRCLYRMLLHDGAPWPVAVFWTSQAAMGISCSWVARPNLFTMLFVLVTARMCVLFHEGHCSRRQTLWLLPLFALWANIHGGFLAGFTLLFATMLIEMAITVIAVTREEKNKARDRTFHLLLLLGGTFLSTLLNPYSLSLYHWLFQLIGDPFFMDLHQEWRSPDFHAKGAIRFEWLMLLFPLLLALSKRRPNLVELGLALLWFHFALTGFRYVALWVLVVVPLLARSSLAIPVLRGQLERLHPVGGGHLLVQCPSWSDPVDMEPRLRRAPVRTRSLCGRAFRSPSTRDPSDRGPSSLPGSPRGVAAEAWPPAGGLPFLRLGRLSDLAWRTRLPQLDRRSQRGAGQGTHTTAFLHPGNRPRMGRETRSRTRSTDLSPAQGSADVPVGRQS